MTSPAPGWYADPNGGAGLRFFNGVGWTDATQAPPAHVPAMANGLPGGQSPPQAPYGFTPQPMAPTGPAAPVTVFAANKLALITIVICAVYAILATESRFVFFGILPVAFTVRSFRAREPLKWLALAAAVATIAYSLYRLHS